jgi:hypothetical protein
MPRLILGALFLAGASTVVPSLEAGAQPLNELAKAHSRKYPGTPLIQVGPPGDYLPKTIEELTREAEIVIHARLVRLKSYVGADGERVLSDFAIRGNVMLAARTADAAAAVQGGITGTLIVTVFGGEVMIEGVEVQSSSGGSAAITDGGEYLLFLKKARRPGAGRYEPYYGAVFSIEEGKLKPLLRDGNRVFKDASEAALPEVVSQIEAAARFR